MSDRKILLVGAGKMGGAILRGMLNAGQKAQAVSIVDPFVGDVEFADCQIYSDVAKLPESYVPEVVLLAVKPQLLDEVIEHYRHYALQGALIISVIAGKDLLYFQKHLGVDVPVIRTMPNLPAAIGKGVTAACANQNVIDSQKAVCETLLSAIGAVVWLESEKDMGAVTALSGSGPAYVFYFLESMVKAACELGLSEDVAFELAKYTFEGSALMMAGEKAVGDVSTLRENVTSKGGTTAAALACLMDDEEGVQKIVRRAMEAAKNRSDELSA